MYNLIDPDDPVDMIKLTASIEKHEGTGPISNGMYLPYKDSLGNETIGTGHLISRGISNAARQQILRDDIGDVLLEIQSQDWFPVIKDDDVRFRAIIEILFNLGINRFNGFVEAIAALRRGDFRDCANQFRDSIWFKQVGERGVILTAMIETGIDPS